MAASAAITWSRLGAPTARPTSIPKLFNINVVGVERISNFRTNSKFVSASISTWRTSLRSVTTFSSKVRVARQGVQKADENCTKVARDPKSPPIMEAVKALPEMALA